MNTSTTTIEKVDSHIDGIIDELIEIRHDLHAHPELGYKENRTSKVIQDFLEQQNIPFKAGLAKGTGVLAHLSGKSKTAIGLRADIDALPIVEENIIKGSTLR